MPGLPTIYAEGPPSARGRQIGGSLGGLIDEQLRNHRARLDDAGLDRVALRAALTPYLEAAERSLPELVEQLRAMASGAEVDFWDLLAMNALEELEPLFSPAPADRCSTLTVRTAETTIFAHNEQWYASDAGLTAIVCERPDRGVPIAGPTAPCYLVAVGANGHGTAQGIDSLTARDDRVGIPRVLVSRHALDARDREDAIARAGIDGRAGGYAHVYAFRDGEAITVETTAEELAVLSAAGPHTNHYLDAGLAELGDAPGAGSLGRYRRLTALLAERPPTTAQDVMRLMADHDASPDAICLHATEDEDSCVVFSMVYDVAARRMWVAPGNPCLHPYEEVDLDAAFL